MLVLSRKRQQQIKIGEHITVTILRVAGSTVRVGIQAPRDVRVIRAELPKVEGAQAEATQREAAQREAASAATIQDGAIEIGTMEIGAVDFIVGSDEPGDALDEAARPCGEVQRAVAARPLVSVSRRLSTLRSSPGPLAHLVAGSAALAK